MIGFAQGAVALDFAGGQRAVGFADPLQLPVTRFAHAGTYRRAAFLSSFAS
jgi:hypothetical protein